MPLRAQCLRSPRQRRQEGQAALPSPPLARQLKVITVAVLSEKFKIGGSLARRFLQEQQTAGKIKAVAPSSKMGVYTRAD
jgi:hypothetical protein